ncbi:MAG: hypothetical protein WCD04_07915, partial [Terriglobia bacterium]
RPPANDSNWSSSPRKNYFQSRDRSTTRHVPKRLAAVSEREAAEIDLCGDYPSLWKFWHL